MINKKIKDQNWMLKNETRTTNPKKQLKLKKTKWWQKTKWFWGVLLISPLLAMISNNENVVQNQEQNLVTNENDEISLLDPIELNNANDLDKPTKFDIKETYLQHLTITHWQRAWDSQYLPRIVDFKTPIFQYDVSTSTMDQKNIANEMKIHFNFGGFHLPSPKKWVKSFGILNVGNYGSQYNYHHYSDKNNTFTNGSDTSIQVNDNQVKIENLNKVIVKGKEFSLNNWNNIVFFSTRQTSWHNAGLIGAYFQIIGRFSENYSKFEFQIHFYAANALGGTNAATKAWIGGYLDNVEFSKPFRYSKLNSNLNNVLKLPINKVLNESNASPSIFDANNQLTLITEQKKRIDKVFNDLKIANLKKYFDIDFSFKDSLPKNIRTTISFSPKKGQFRDWRYDTAVRLKLGDEYYKKSIEDRISIKAGKIAKIQDGKQVLVDDIPIEIKQGDSINNTKILEDDKSNSGSIWEYNTSVNVRFISDNKNIEALFINGKEIDVVNNTFEVELRDTRFDFINKSEVSNEIKKTEDNNKYVIEVRRKNINNNVSSDENAASSNVSYKKTIVINSYLSNLDLKYYAWDPNNSNNTSQKNSITPKLLNGEQNPNYNPKINPKTGTINQIIWVKKPSSIPFANDPLNKKGLFLKENEISDDGYIAEGIVSFKGIKESWNDNQKITREGLDQNLNLLNSSSKMEKSPNLVLNKEIYFSNTGIWKYTINNNDKAYGQKIVLINEENKNLDFLSQFNDEDVVYFWNTVQGNHLAYYLHKYRFFNDKTMQNLSYEEVLSYWNEYVYLTKEQRIEIPEKTFDWKNFDEYKLTTIKVKENNASKLKSEVTKQLNNQLNNQKLKDQNLNLVLNEHYEISNFVNDENGEVLDIDWNNNVWNELAKINLGGSSSSKEVNLKLNAKIPNSKIIGNNTVKVINNINYQIEKMIDLSKLNLGRYAVNINNKEDLEKYVKAYVQTFFTKNNLTKALNLKLDEDYEIKLEQNQNWENYVLDSNNNEIQSISFVVWVEALDNSQNVFGFNKLNVHNASWLPKAMNSVILDDGTLKDLEDEITKFDSFQNNPVLGVINPVDGGGLPPLGTIDPDGNLIGGNVDSGDLGSVGGGQVNSLAYIIPIIIISVVVLGLVSWKLRNRIFNVYNIKNKKQKITLIKK